MAAKEQLSRRRSELVKRISRPSIRVLVDYSLLERILNFEEVDSILANRTTTDQARDLIDRVICKGELASRKTIEHLRHIDPFLSHDLDLCLTEDALPAVTGAASSHTEQQWSKTLIRSTEAFWREKQKDTYKVYPATQESIRNRVALLITNIEFINKEDNRDGAEKDEENMYNLLSDLGYDVVKHTNRTAKEIDKALDEFSRHSKLQHTDSVIVVIMSHGNPGTILGINHIPHTSPDEFPIDNICKHLGSENCAALLNKPKIIIIQACRGEAEGSVRVSDGQRHAMTDAMKPHPSQSAEHLKDGSEFVHREKDFIFLHSSTRDTVSYRDPDIGSPLILAIVDVFNTLAHENSIDELFLIVGRYVRDYPIGDSGEKQMPCRERCSLDRHFYLFPGIGKRNLLLK